MAKFMGTVLQTSKSIFDKWNANIVASEEKIKRWAREENKEGRNLEELVASLCRMLEGVEEVYLAEVGSELDYTIKADVVLVYKNGVHKAIQIKSSKGAAIKHLQQGNVCDGVLYLEGDSVKDSPLELLKLLMKTFDAKVCHPVLEIAGTAAKYKGKCFLVKNLPFNFFQIDSICRLGLAKVEEGRLYF